MIMKCFSFVFYPITKLYGLINLIKNLYLKPENRTIQLKSENSTMRHILRSEILEKIECAQSKNKDLILDRREAAAFLSVKIGTLAMWKSNKRYSLPYIKVGRHIRYKASDLIKFLENNVNA